jgi:hypothetical protein
MPVRSEESLSRCAGSITDILPSILWSMLGLMASALSNTCLVWMWSLVWSNIIPYSNNTFSSLGLLLHRRCFYEFRKHLQYAFWCAYNFYVQPSVSHQLSFHTKTRTISYMHIFSIFGRLYHINCETNMHIFSCLGRLYHINSQIYVYAFAPGRVYINALIYHQSIYSLSIFYLLSM